MPETRYSRFKKFGILLYLVVNHLIINQWLHLEVFKKPIGLDFDTQWICGEEPAVCCL